MILPKELLKIATLGTEHNDVDTAMLGDDVLPERRLLRTVAGAKLRERAGWIPKIADGALPELCERDARELCSSQVAQHLTAIIRGDNLGTSRLLPEWIDAATAMDVRIPPEMLPLMLDSANIFHRLRSHIGQFAGERGVWLTTIGHHEAWCWLVPQAFLHLWYEPQNIHRYGIIERLRFNDPAKARELIADVWETEPDRTRYSLLKTLDNQLSVDDEEFLESIFDDASPATQKIIVELLAKIPQSQFCQKMMRLGIEMLVLEAAVNGLTAVMKYPEAIDDDLIRYGMYEERINNKTLIKRVVKHIPPKFWCEQWAMNAGEVIEAIANNKRSAAFLWEALCYSVSNIEDEAFAEYLLFSEHFLRLSHRDQRAIAKIVAPEHREIRAIQYLREDYPIFDSRVIPLFPIWNTIKHWSVELTSAFIAYWENYLGTLETIPSRFFQLFDEFSYRIALELATEYVSLFDLVKNPTGDWLQLKERVQNLLTFRGEMLEALRNG